MIKQRSLLKFILLGIITLGIYDIVFLYGWTKDNNTLCKGVGKDSPNYIAVLLLSMITCGIYGLYWYFKMGDRLTAGCAEIRPFPPAWRYNNTAVDADRLLAVRYWPPDCNALPN